MYKVNDNDKALFDQDGFLVVDRLIAADSLPPLHRAFDDLFHGRFETGVRPDEVNWQAATGDPDLSRQICNGWKANRRIARVVLDAGLAKNIAALGGWPGVRIMIDNVLWKPPATKSLGFHQDSAYLAWFTPSELLTCWIALDDTRADGGTIEFVRGSHKWQPGMPEPQTDARRGSARGRRTRDRLCRSQGRRRLVSSRLDLAWLGRQREPQPAARAGAARDA
jgi:ectoine hydroxylase-related dioxygenase (phytanoyl-CoA dioxygenase family)